MGIKIVPKSLFCLYCFKGGGVFDCCDLSFFQLSLLGKKGGGI